MNAALTQAQQGLAKSRKAVLDTVRERESLMREVQGSRDELARLGLAIEEKLKGDPEFQIEAIRRREADSLTELAALREEAEAEAAKIRAEAEGYREFRAKEITKELRKESKKQKAEAEKILTDARKAAKELVLEAQIEVELEVQDIRHDIELRGMQLEDELEQFAEREAAVRALETDFEKRRQRVELKQEQEANWLAMERKTIEKTKEDLKRKLHSERAELRAWKRDKPKLEEQLEAANQRVEALKQNRARLPMQTGHLLANSPKINDWLESLHSIYELDGWSTELATTGNGPFVEDFFDSVLKDYGYEPRLCGASGASVLIVGREDWTEEGLEEQIEAREGDTLKVYSQEMAVIAIATGNDPFDADEDLLLEFGQDHPALQFLMNNEFAWPGWQPRGGGGIIIDSAEWRRGSPLTAMGYHVGVTSELHARERHQLLTRIFKRRLIFPADFSSEEREGWGTPGQSRRLRMIAVHIAKNIAVHGARLGYNSVAAKEWQADLAWLKKQYYDRRLKFRWPDTTVYR